MLPLVNLLFKKIEKSKLRGDFSPRDREKESNLQRVKIIRVKIIQRKNVDFVKDFDGSKEIGQI